jgi:hypothetical protein
MKNQTNFDTIVLPIATFKSKVKYHSAHMKDNCEQYSLIEVLDKDEGVIRLSDTLHDFLVKFIPIGLSNMIPQEQNGPNMELDEYAGLLAVASKYKGITSAPGQVIFKELQYQFAKGYVEIQSNNWGQVTFYPLEDASNIGYIFKPENALLNLFNNKLIHVENLTQGMISIRTSTFDSQGYKCQFPREFIFELSQKADSIRKQEEKTLTEKFDIILNKVESIALAQEFIINRNKILQDISTVQSLLVRNTLEIAHTIEKVFPQQFAETQQEVAKFLNPTFEPIGFTEININPPGEVNILGTTINNVDQIDHN